MPTDCKFVKIGIVMKMTGKSRSAIYAEMDRSDFPKQVKTGKRAVAWVLEDILQWQQDCIRRSRGS
ncbi:helix-turn-helix transcriptional regulator [Noviherbaspirillum malthae]|uniref:helix-turn-helix transcriptional regulator n=1 Tax=Noviherbaspirillum malthae TaxID=1260987 RepID=UPI00188E8657|nr:AlpA family phage regulatory protein [Noviherbaspirillum malthae]